MGNRAGTGGGYDNRNITVQKEEEMRLGLLHPGEMGASVGAAARAAGAEVLWASRGRSRATRERAEAARMRDAGDLGALLGASEAVLSVCPPHCALDLAGEVAEEGFSGLYVDANAIAPGTSRAIERMIGDAGASYVDGGLIGPPARAEGTTRLYLSGPRAPEVAALFAGSVLGTEVIGESAGQASALKMAYAAWTKGSDALLLAVRAYALAEGVEEALIREWGLSQAGLANRSERTGESAGKAWRFEGEMHQIGHAFGDAGLPEGFHRAAASVYRRLRGYKGTDDTPPMADLLGAVRYRRGGA